MEYQSRIQGKKYITYKLYIDFLWKKHFILKKNKT